MVECIRQTPHVRPPGGKGLPSRGLARRPAPSVPFGPWLRAPASGWPSSCERERADTRRTFTLAHELGHILIPWHTGQFICKPDSIAAFEGSSKFFHDELGREANRFAAEFLMPTFYVQELFAQLRNPILMLEKTSGARISKLAASIRFLRCLPPDFLMVEIGSRNEVIHSGRTNLSLLKTPEVGSIWSDSSYVEMGAKVRDTTSSSGRVIWVDARNVQLERPHLEPGLAARDIANAIFDDLGRSCDKVKLLQSINGVIGAANGRVLQNGTADLYTFLCSRFKDRPQWKGVVTHPRFKEFLAARAREIEERNG